MVRLVTADWVEGQLASGRLTPVDPRSPVRYMQGHLRHAISVPVARALGPDGRLLPEARLASWLEESGVGTEASVVVYDTYDGQSGSFLAWLLEYLGHGDVRFLDVTISAWKSQGRELLYRPVPAQRATFVVRARPELRSRLEDILEGRAVHLLDVRSPDEFSGELVTDGRGGHIPGAKHMPWLSLVDEDERGLFRSQGALRRLLAGLGIEPGQGVVVYCRSGPRAAVAYVALQQLGHPVSVYDGSFAEWAAQLELPVET